MAEKHQSGGTEPRVFEHKPLKKKDLQFGFSLALRCRMKPLYLFCIGISLLAQDPSPGWRRFGDANSSSSTAPQNFPQTQQPQDAPQPYPQNAPPAYSQNAPQPYAQPPMAQPQQGPIDLTLPAGSWITARVNEPLSSNHSQPGDAFTATLAQPLIVNGLVVARSGQLVYGRIVDVTKAGRVKGVSSMGVELTEIGLVDGQHLPIKTQLIERRGDTSVGNDVAAVGVTTGLGAAIGAAAGGGWGAGIGALAGAAVGTTGVLSTRGRETVLFPEQVLTFRVESSVHIASQASAAFQPPSQYDYNRPQIARAPAPRPVYPAYPYVAPYPYYGGFGGYFYGGPGYFYGRGYYRRY